MWIGGADTHVARLVVNHEGKPVFGLHVQQPLWVLGADTDIAHRRQQVVPLFRRGLALPGNEQVLGAIVLQVAVPVLDPQPDDVPVTRIQLQQAEVIAPGVLRAGIDFRFAVLRRVVGAPLVRIPLLCRRVVHHESKGRRGVESPAELHCHADGIRVRRGRTAAVCGQLRHMHHSRYAFPHRSLAIGELDIDGNRIQLDYRDIFFLHPILNQVVGELHRVCSRRHVLQTVETVGVGPRVPVGVRHPHHDALDRLRVLGRHRALDVSAHQGGQRLRLRKNIGFGSGDGDILWVVVGLVTAVDEAHLVASYRYLVDLEGTVAAGVADIVGALDHHEGAGVVSRLRPFELAGTAERSRWGQFQVHYRSRVRRHHRPRGGLHPVPAGLDEIGAGIKTTQDIHPLGVGHGHIGVSRVGGGPDGFLELVGAGRPGGQHFRLLRTNTTLVYLAGHHQDSGAGGAIGEHHFARQGVAKCCQRWLTASGGTGTTATTTSSAAGDYNRQTQKEENGESVD